MLPIKEFIKVVHRPYPPFYRSLIAQYSDENIWKDFIGFRYGMKDIAWIDGDVYYPKYQQIDFPKKITKILFRDKKYFLRIKKETLKREKLFLESINKDLGTFCQRYGNYMPTIGLYYVCDDIIENKVRGLLSKKVEVKKVDEMMHYLNIPVWNNFKKQEEVDLVKTKDIINHVRKYRWLRSRYGSLNHYTVSEAQRRRKILVKENFLEKYNAEKLSVGKIVSSAKKMVGKKHEHIIDIMQFFIYYRTMRTDVINMAAYLYASKIQMLATKLGMSYEDFLFCTYDEIIGDIPDKKIIRERQKTYSFVMTDGKYKILIGAEHIKLKKQFEVLNAQVKELTGRVAYRGKVTGTVVIIKNFSDIHKVKKGDILVTYMTTTEMVPAMHRARAFVTNEGGITCHAAIMAREMKKPCIMSTKIATQVFKDGDKIEVNANHGWVRKIS